MKKIIIVYYIFINEKRNWKKIIKGQIQDVLIAGLINSEFHIHICCSNNNLINECKDFVKKLINKTIYFTTNNENQFEYPGFKLIYDLSQENPDTILLYLHTKGMVFHHSNERDMCEKTILRMTIDNWENTINIFEENKNINKIGVFPAAPEGWVWFNFFWVRSDYVANEPEYTPDNRFYYESYIGRNAPKINNGCSDCYSLIDNKISAYEHLKLIGLIYDQNLYIFDMTRISNGIGINVKFNKRNYSFLYGSPDVNLIDITEQVYSKYENDNIIYIPSGDVSRANLFSDPCEGVHKYIFIKDYFGKMKKYNVVSNIYVDLYENKIYTVDDLPTSIKNINFTEKLKNIHSNLKINYGDFLAEYPEQVMSIKYIKGPEKVLEIGANIGRNTLVISSLLNDSSNLVTLECDPLNYSQLIENKQLNNFNFQAENSALSARKLIQKVWSTIPSDELLEGYTWVNTITFNQFKQKYPLQFDTLVLDCEGAFYYILSDYPEILNNINLIIMENDYLDITHKEYIDKVLKNNNFYIDYSEGGGWGPCANNFYEVWKR